MLRSTNEPLQRIGGVESASSLLRVNSDDKLPNQQIAGGTCETNSPQCRTRVTNQTCYTRERLLCRVIIKMVHDDVNMNLDDVTLRESQKLKMRNFSGFGLIRCENGKRDVIFSRRLHKVCGVVAHSDTI